MAVAPDESLYARDSAAWRDELADLQREIDRDLADSIEGDAVEGWKGDPLTASIIVALISSGAVTALFNCVKAWINRDAAHRRVQIRFGEAESDQVVIDSSNVDDETMKAAVTGALNSRT